MRQKMSFRERVLRAYAAVMKFLAPTYCVKKLTLSYIKTKNGGSRKNANAYLFLPGVEKELKAIEKLQLGEAALKLRAWSYDTEIELLKKGNFALVSRIKTEEALNLVIEQGYINPICEAMNVYTPSKGYLLKLMHHWNREKLLAVIAAVPAAFDSLKEWEILGIEEKQAYKGEELWAVARALVNAKPEKWAPKFINEVMKIVPSRLNEALETLSLCVEKAMEKKLDISESMPYLMVIHPALYAFVRASLAQTQGHNLVPYVKMMFPQLVDKLDGSFTSIYGKNAPSGWTRATKKLSEEQEAACWLFFALAPGTMDLVVANLSAIKDHISAKAFADVECEVLQFSGIHEVEKLMRFYKEDAQKLEVLRDSLLKCAGFSDNWVLMNYYPFDGWTDEQKEKAIRAMAIGKTLPEDLYELSDELEAVAIEELEIQSEIAVIRGGSCGEKETLMTQKLHPRSEEVLFTYYYGTLYSYAPQYIQNFCMAESSFKELVSNIRDSDGYPIEKYVTQLIQLHAEKWGLSEKNYRDLMQSKHYNKLAAVLKKCYKPEENDNK